MRHALSLSIGLVALAGCVGGAIRILPEPVSRDAALQVSAAGLAGTLVVADAFGEQLTLTAAAPTAQLARVYRLGSAYALQVVSQPAAPAQDCTFVAAAGAVNEALTTAVIECVDLHTLSVAPVGLASAVDVVLQAGASEAVRVQPGVAVSFAPRPVGAAWTLALGAPHGALQSCSLSATSGALSGDITVSLSCAEVQPQFPSSQSWATYVRRSAAAPWQEASPPLPCTASDRRCWHAAEAWFVELPGVTSCDGVSAVDTAAAFAWRCLVIDGTARVASYDMPGRLANLLDVDRGAWRSDLSVIVTSPSGTRIASRAVWWTNPVFVNRRGGQLSGAGSVHVYVPDGTTPTAVSLLDERMSFVFPATPSNFFNPSGAATPVSVSDRPFAWIEGRLHTSTADSLVSVVRSHHSQLRHLLAAGRIVCPALECRAITISESPGTVLRDVRIAGPSQSVADRVGVRVASSDDVLLDNVYVALTPPTALALVGSKRAVVSRFFAYSGGGVTIDSASTDAVLTGVLVAGNDVTFNNKDVAFSIANDVGTVLQNVTIANSQSAASLGRGATLISLLGMNFGGLQANDVISVGLFGRNTVMDLVSVLTRPLAVIGDYNLVLGSLRFANLTNCVHSASGVTVPGIGSGCNTAANDPSFDECSDCTAVAPSNFTLGVPIAVAQGRSLLVSSFDTDVRNGLIDGSGAVSFDSLRDSNAGPAATLFETPFRGFTGYAGGLFPAVPLRTICRDIEPDKEDCRPFDFRTRANDGGIGSLTGATAIEPGNMIALSHRWAAADATQCALIPGAVFAARNCAHPLLLGPGSATCIAPASGGSDCRSSFVANAFERMFDGIGNDNGLCEAGEDCVQRGNFGAYQGDGALNRLGDTSAAAVPEARGAVIYRYEALGVQ